jgi:hypothetical protein
MKKMKNVTKVLDMIHDMARDLFEAGAMDVTVDIA